VNLAFGSEGFIPSLNTVMGGFLAIGVDLLAETNEYVAVLESVCAEFAIGCPKPAYSFSRAVTITYKEMISLILVKVCDFVEFAFYHIKKLPRCCAFALCDLRDLEQSLLTKVVKIGVIITLPRRVRHRRNSERKVKRAILVIDKLLQGIVTSLLLFGQIRVNLFKQFGGGVALAIVGAPVIAISYKRLHHSPVRSLIVLEILAVDFRVFLLLQLD